jgi:hypothetical protein
MFRHWMTLSFVSLLAACGGGETDYQVGGTVTGLAGTLVLRDVSGEQLTLTGSGNFALAARVPAGTPYAIGVAQQPAGQACSVSNGSGTVSADVNNIQVACATATYPVSVQVPAVDAPLVLTSSLGESLTVTTAGTYTFTVQAPHGQVVNVSVQAAAAQACTVNGGGVPASGQPLQVSVSCAKTWRLGGTVSGLTGTATLRNSDGQSVAVAGDGAFTFPGVLADGAAYAVSVDAPAGQRCAVANGSGVANADVTSVAVTCSAIVAVAPPQPPAPDPGPAAGPPPSVPAGLTVSYAIKRYVFSWNAAAGATSYQLFEDPDGPGPLGASAVSGSLATTTFTLDHAVPLPRRFNAQYRVQACNADGCAQGASIQPDLVRAVGYFKASNAESDDRFGSAVALSADGTTLAVAAQAEDSAATGVNGNQADNSASESGAVYVFVKSGGVWSQQAYLKASNARASANFGLALALALSADGNTLAVGAIAEASNATGINGNQADTSAPNAGAVYVFVRSGTAWSQQAYVKSSNTEAGDSFARSVALSGDGNTLAVGAIGESSNATGIGGNQADNSMASAGATYVFTRSGTVWSQQAYIKSTHPDAGDQFGRIVALSHDGHTLAVGVMFESSAAAGINGNPADNTAASAGAVFMYTRSGGIWSQHAYIKPSNPGAGDQFGFSVALSGDGNTLAVGATEEASAAPGINADQADNSLASGAAYVFVRNGAAWSQQAYIKASNPGANDGFGFSAALSADGNTLAVSAARESGGAPGVNGNQGDDSLQRAGAAYLFTRSAGAWSQAAYVKAAVPKAIGLFGFSIALSGDGGTLAVGSTGDNSAATGIGGNAADTSALATGAVLLY